MPGSVGRWLAALDMDVLDAIRHRRSHRTFATRQVEAEKIDAVLEAACWAPSPANTQPWEFVVITSEASRNKLYELSEEARKKGTVELHGFSYIRPMPFDSVEKEESGHGASVRAYSFAFLKKAPVIVAVIGLTGTPIRPAGVERPQDGYKYACAAAIQNMLLAAHSMGLGSLWYTFFEQDLVRQFLNINESKLVVALVCLGYPAGEARSPGRHSVESKVRRFD